MTDTTTIPTGAWTQVTCIVSSAGGTTCKFYINGVLSSTVASAISVPLGFPGGQQQIGNGGLGGNQVDGYLDDSMIYVGTMAADLNAMLYHNEHDPTTFYTITSNVSWTASCTMGLSCDGHSGSTMAYNPKCLMDLAFDMHGPGSISYNSAKCSMDLVADAAVKSTMSYNSPNTTIDLVFDMHAESSTGTVPITCITGSGTPGVVPPTHDPGYTY
jgi:hypothetical protein